MSEDSKFNQKKYWQDVADKSYSNANLKDEFDEGIFDVGMAQKGRRDFLKIMGFSLSVLPVVSSCKKIPRKSAIPFLDRTEDIVPGVANWYASTNGLCPSATPIIVKTREGRPIKIEGNKLSPLTKGGVSPACQASVLSLYDSSRFKSPQKKNQYTTFGSIDHEIIQSLKQSRQTGKRVAVVLDALRGPSSKQVLDTFSSAYGNVDIIIYNPLGKSSEVEANQKCYGRQEKHLYNFLEADIIVSIDHDFLNAGVEPVYLTKQYSKRRDVSADKNIVRHIHIEDLMSLTGSNADQRLNLSESEISLFIHNLLNYVQDQTSKKLVPVIHGNSSFDQEVINVGNELLRKKGSGLVTYGGHSVENHIKVNAINEALGNVSNTVELNDTEYTKHESDSEFVDFLGHCKAGKYSHVFFVGTNPYYDFYNLSLLEGALGKVPTKVSLSTSPDETSKQCLYVSPDRHYLEKWNDYEISKGVFSFAQPVIKSLFNNRPLEDSFLIWSEDKKSFLDVMKETWRKILNKSGMDFDAKWNKMIHDGILVRRVNRGPELRFQTQGKSVNEKAPKINAGVVLRTYQKIGLHKGKFANNPWLQELPDPITKATWDNYLQVSPKYADKNGLKLGDLVEIVVGGNKLRIPILVQPGTNDNTVGLALGYGRTVCGRAGKDVGVNAFGFTSYQGQSFSSGLELESLVKLNQSYKIAQTQTHHSLEGRDIVKETVLGSYVKDPASGNSHEVHLYSMWKGHKKKGNQWAMAIDLNKCTGCSGCVVSCNAENNVPVVGKEEVYNRREMHWIRLDRYYKGEDQNPQVVHQPMTCMHCDNAPCETVCPVLATVQSSDGLNQQVYNRCVGTRYCANNCPYKVRRFNWFEYARDDKLENMVLNPDVTVRSRGVMEKCTMCIQRIQEKRILAKKEGREIKDGEIQLACQQSCPGDAIVFGDLNDPNSEISKKIKDPRYYRAIEELGIEPRVGYMTKVRNDQKR